MSTTTLRPNAQVGTDTTGLIVAATPTAALNDNNDASYMSRSASQAALTFELGTYTKPAGSMTKSVTTRCRIQPTSGSCRAKFHTNSPTLFKNASVQPNVVVSSLSTVTGPSDTGLGDLTQAAIDALRFVCQAVSPTTSNVRFVEGYVDVLDAEIATTTYVSPTGTVSTDTFDVTWSHTAGTDGGPQVWYQVKVFSAAQFNGVGFSADTTPAFFDSGEVASSATVRSVMAPAGSIRVYVRTAQSVNGAKHWAAWDFEAITVSLTTSEVLDLTTTIDNSLAKVLVTVSRDTGTDAWHHVDIQRSDTTNELGTVGQFTTGSPIGTGWAAYQVGSPTSASRSIQASGANGRGNHQRVAATTTNLTSYGLVLSAPLDAIAVVPGDVVEFSLDYKGTFAATSRLNLLVWFSTAGGSLIADTRTIYTPVTDTDWKRAYATFTAPAGAATVECFFEITASTGTAAAATLDVDEARVLINPEWHDVRNVADFLPAANSGSWNDYEMPPDVPVRYRSRAVKSDGTMGSWMEQVGTTEWSVTQGVWFKQLFDSAAGTTFHLNLMLRDTPARLLARRHVEHQILNAKFPVVTSDVRSARKYRLVVVTQSQDEQDELELMCDEDRVLCQFRDRYRVQQGWFHPGDLEEIPFSDRWAGTDQRFWDLTITEVAEP